MKLSSQFKELVAIMTLSIEILAMGIRNIAAKLAKTTDKEEVARLMKLLSRTYIAYRKKHAKGK